MKALLRKVHLALSAVRLLPHMCILWTLPSESHLRADIHRWSQVYPSRAGESAAGSFIYLMTTFPEFRSLFYYRAGFKGRIFSALCPPLPTLYLATKSIGPGLFIQHGFATIIAARSIGANCWINQQVTIGFSNAHDQPTLEDNVTVSAGAKILGAVTVGRNSKVGANAVVVKNVPPNVTVVGVPARIVRRDGRRVTEGL